jgi:hypothetical protein
VPPEPLPRCGKCGRELTWDLGLPDTALYVAGKWGGPDGGYDGQQLVVCRLCAVPVVDALKAVLEQRHG